MGDLGVAPRGYDVHDRAIQELFGVGLMLQSTLGRIADPEAREWVAQSMSVLDEIIDDIRFVLSGRADENGPAIF